MPGTEAVFTVTAIGKATLKYQWQSRKDANSAWTNSGMPGAKTATLRVPATLGLNGWQFRCVVTDGNGENTWLGSDLRLNLNGNDFLFKIGVFTEQERNAIMVSKIASHSLVQGTSAWNVSSWTKGIFKNYVPITSERIFLLDAEDASNSYYGYNYSDAAMTGRLKKYNGVTADYWSRTVRGVACVTQCTGAS